jgi:LysM repeat protein
MGRLLTRLFLVLFSVGAIIGAVVVSEAAPKAQTPALISYPQGAWVHKLADPKPVVPQAPTTYTVAAGDTLSGIGQHFGRSWQQFAGYNSLTWAQAQAIIPGQKLRIPPASYKPALSQPVGHAATLTGVYNPAVHAHNVPLPVGTYSFTALEALWESVGGPAWAAPQAARIAECESGGNPSAYNHSGASGLWQILGSVRAGNLFNPIVNAENAVAKFHGSNDTFAQWVCR